jgi:hypothetical protein
VGVGVRVEIVLAKRLIMPGIQAEVPLSETSPAEEVLRLFLNPPIDQSLAER